MTGARPLGFVLLFAAFLSPATVLGQTAGPPTVEDLSWLAGRWAGESGGMRFEEHWSAPAGEEIMGMFRWVEGDSVRLYEFLAIESDSAGPTLLLRHFGPGLVPWEEAALRFRFVEMGERRVVFEAQEEEGPTRLVYESPDQDTLIAVLEKDRGGETSRSEFRYRRVEGGE